MYKIFAGSFVDCPSLGQLKIYNDHLLKIDHAGFISEFAPRLSVQGAKILASLPPAQDESKFLPKYSFLLPTFCDLHLHAPQSLYLGTGLHLPLLKWLDIYAFNAEERIDADPDLASRVYTKLASRLAQTGTGAVLLFGTIQLESNLLLARVFQQTGLRAFVGKLSMDTSTRPSYVEPSTDASVRAIRNFIDQCNALVSHLPPHQRLVHPVITPRFVPTCTDHLLSQLGDIARQTDTMVQSHLAEAKDQTEWVKRTRGVDDIEIFARSGLLTPRTVQAHCTFLSPPSLSQLQKSGTAIAHCPLSNSYFSSRPFPLREALNLGVKVGLGTDVAGGYECDMMNAMRSAVVVSKLREGQRIEHGDDSRSDHALDIDWKEALYLATTAGAQALNLPTGRSAFEIGLPFDMQQSELVVKSGGGLKFIYMPSVDVYDETRQEGVGKLDFFDNPGPDLSEEMVEKWWCLGNESNRSAVYIQGKSIL